MSNRLKYQSSPYLLQHAENPVDWYPWGEEAFEKAKREDKPIFLSIGYSTCHWCHVMAHESFENGQIADILNQYYVCIKVDREERPDVDGVYMTVCQAMTESGGWPTSLFLTPERKPFYAGTYFPPFGRGGRFGFYELLLHIAEKWQSDRAALVSSADKVTEYLKNIGRSDGIKPPDDITGKAVEDFARAYDRQNGGFGKAPKFPSPHNLLFLLLYGRLKKNAEATDMALHTLRQMGKGGIYDHIGGGFSRYSVDKIFLVPHFEKMLYDNALLIIAYSAAYAESRNEAFLRIAEETAEYIFREMTHWDGGFYSARDADSEGGEGLYYLFTKDEIVSVLGQKKGREFCEYYGITEAGNFEGRNILNRLGGELGSGSFTQERKMLYDYRKARMPLHLDDKILTSWNGLMIAAMCSLYRVSGDKRYLDGAIKADEYIKNNLCHGDRLYVGIREGKVLGKGFLDDYAFYVGALLALYSATGEEGYLDRAKLFCRAAAELFGDGEGGYFMSGKENEALILSPKESYDGALPSGNTAMGYALVRLAQLDPSDEWEDLLQKQKEFLYGRAAKYPTGHSLFLLSLLVEGSSPPKIVAVCGKGESLSSVAARLPLYADVTVLPNEKDGYGRLGDGTTFYVCKGQTCLPPTQDIGELI